MKQSRAERNLITKILKASDDHEIPEYTKREIELVLSNYNPFYDMYDESLYLEVFKRCLFDKKFVCSEKLVDIFNTYCCVKPFFHFNYLPDGGEELDKENPFSGFGVEIDELYAFKQNLKSVIEENKATIEAER